MKADIERVVDLASGKRSILKGFVTRAEWIGHPEHPYRHAPFNAGGVPCMVLFEGAQPLFKLDDVNQFHDQDVMDKFLEDL